MRAHQKSERTFIGAWGTIGKADTKISISNV